METQTFIFFEMSGNRELTLAYVPVSANWERTSSGHFKLRLAIPISPLAKPRPSTTATITEASVFVDPDEQLLPTTTQRQN